MFHSQVTDTRPSYHIIHRMYSDIKNYQVIQHSINTSIAQWLRAATHGYPVILVGEDHASVIFNRRS